ncbi:hypothetical protein I41_49420 [Lacipirellula limnantheis]|uniref:Uncharacterized protein n=1 Tax=Lacipirellula limnantheis TaxID=2528024 RepID=A0A517U564_9BACT|nr:hypothetical protein I41_49420 [Lacipirellula limnantheis]
MTLDFLSEMSVRPYAVSIALNTIPPAQPSPRTE